jgi:hypothetical protein
LILIYGVLHAHRHFPQHQDTRGRRGLDVQRIDAAGHVRTGHESQSLYGRGIVKIFFQQGTDVAAAQAQVVAVSQTVLKQMPTGVKAKIPQIQKTLPAGVKITTLSDASVFVKHSVEDVVQEMATAAVVTGLVVLLFLGSGRSTLIVATSIPLSILCSIMALSWFGQTINVMTLGGLALAVGILVDDATVMIENISDCKPNCCNAVPTLQAPNEKWRRRMRSSYRGNPSANAAVAGSRYAHSGDRRRLDRAKIAHRKTGHPVRSVGPLILLPFGLISSYYAIWQE